MLWWRRSYIFTYIHKSLNTLIPPSREQLRRENEWRKENHLTHMIHHFHALENLLTELNLLKLFNDNFWDTSNYFTWNSLTSDIEKWSQKYFWFSFQLQKFCVTYKMKLVNLKYQLDLNTATLVTYRNLRRRKIRRNWWFMKDRQDHLTCF